MEPKWHLMTYFFVWLGWNIIKFYLGTASVDFLKASFVAGMLIMNPDFDQAFARLFNKEIHRWGWLHSAIFPLLIYWGFHGYINMITAREFAYILFLPVMVHLILDLHAKHGLKGMIGTWDIHFFPLPYHLTGKQSLLWLICNIAGMGIYIYFA
jgi:hypothetical protein